MSRRGLLGLVVCFVALTAAPKSLFGQRDRLAGIQIDRRRTVTLTGHVHPAAAPANESGRADAAMPMPNLSLMLKPSAEQQRALEDLLTRQQDPSSPDYHHWLTPEEYADRFGVSDADLAKISAWLQSEGFTAISTARGRNSITFKGSASQAENAFHTQIHRYMVRGELHYANATDPSIPAALSGLVGEIRGLHDFRPRARARILKQHYTAASGNHYIAPDDVATIYDYKPLYSQSINGSGQKIVIVGQTQLPLIDIQNFRAYFNLPASDPTTILVPNLPDPGISQADLGEADLDVETAGAVARGATVLFVYSSNVDDATTYAINQNLAPVLSSSYGLCEADSGSFFTQSQRTLAQQANAQGITWVTAAGDSGAVDCYSDTARTASGLGVDEPGSIPEVTSVGGTEFNEGSGNYWNSSNDANHASALSYIPETTWNDSVSDGSPSASGGGASLFFSKPSWQTGKGVPNDSARDVPDLSFSASADHDGYLIISGGGQAFFGGTSAAAPLFGGMLTLLNQYQVANGFQKTAGLGNINPKLYALAASSPSVFHDVTTGNNAVDPCDPKAKGCTPGSTIGFNATPGYDQATGLGSIDLYNLATAWHIAPAITSGAAIVSAASFRVGIAANSWITISGTNLSSVTDTWTNAVGANGQLPTTLDDVSVSIGGKPAYIYYVSPSQINVLAPNISPGTVTITVTNALGTSAPVNATATLMQPAFFQWGSYAVATRLDYSYAVKNGVLTGLTTVPAKPGDKIILWGTGFGAGNPAAPTGFVTPSDRVYNTASAVTVTVGGASVPVLGAALTPGAAGLYQVAIQLPTTLANNDYQVVATVGGVQSPATTLLTVHN